MPATVKGGFWGDISASYTEIDGDNPNLNRIRQALNKEGLREYEELMETLNGVAPGAAALAQYTRVANSADLSGLRAIETVDAVNRVTAAADVTRIHQDLYSAPTSPTYVANLDGNPRGYPGG